MPRIPYWPDKDPDDIAAYRVDWEDRLDGDTISTSTFTVDAGTCVVDSSDETTTTASAAISGGAEGETCEIRNRITTAALKTFDQTVLLRIRKR